MINGIDDKELLKLLMDGEGTDNSETRILKEILKKKMEKEREK